MEVEVRKEVVMEVATRVAARRAMEVIAVVARLEAMPAKAAIPAALKGPVPKVGDGTGEGARDRAASMVVAKAALAKLAAVRAASEVLEAVLEEALTAAAGTEGTEGLSEAAATAVTARSWKRATQPLLAHLCHTPACPRAPTGTYVACS